MQHQARKRFGQNFLHDQGIIGRIHQAIAAKEGDNMVEIGPGQGAITEGLLERCGQLQVVELDRDLIPILRTKFFNFPGLQIHQGDALQYDFAQLQSAGPLRIVGNLPYNISSPLIFHLIGFSSLVRDMHFMLQKEVVERLCAVPGNGDYGRLSIMVQYHCRAEHLFNVKPGCFHPAPKVESAIIRLTPIAPALAAKDSQLMAKLVKQAFSTRRKTIRNNLKPLLGDAMLEDLGIDPGLRPENLSVTDYVRLSNALWDQDNTPCATP